MISSTVFLTSALCSHLFTQRTYAVRSGQALLFLFFVGGGVFFAKPGTFLDITGIEMDDAH